MIKPDTKPIDLRNENYTQTDRQKIKIFLYIFKAKMSTGNTCIIVLQTQKRHEYLCKHLQVKT